MTEMNIDLSRYHNPLGWRHQAVRLVWNIVWPLATCLLPRSSGMGWKRLLLRIFGARVASSAQVYSSARIYYPPNLMMGPYSCLDARVNCYNVAPISIGAHTTVSQGAFLCTASHDIRHPLNPLLTAPIRLEDQVWVAAEAFVGMGVTVGQGAVVGARAVAVKDVSPWTVVGGNPARFLKNRVLISSPHA